MQYPHTHFEQKNSRHWGVSLNVLLLLIIGIIVILVIIVTIENGKWRDLVFTVYTICHTSWWLTPQSLRVSTMPRPRRWPKRTWVWGHLSIDLPYLSCCILLHLFVSYLSDRCLTLSYFYLIHVVCLISAMNLSYLQFYCIYSTYRIYRMYLICVTYIFLTCLTIYSDFLSFYLCLSVYLLFYRSVCLSVPPSVCLSVYDNESHEIHHYFPHQPMGFPQPCSSGRLNAAQDVAREQKTIDAYEACRVEFFNAFLKEAIFGWRKLS